MYAGQSKSEVKRLDVNLINSLVRKEHTGNSRVYQKEAAGVVSEAATGGVL